MIKRLLKCIKEYKKYTILTPTMIIFEVILDILIPFYMAKLIDYGVSVGNMNYIYKIGFILIAMALISLLFGILSGLFAAKSGAGFAKNIRKELYYKIQNFSFSNIDKFSSPSLITRLTTDVNYLQNAFTMIIRIAVRAPLMVIFSFIMAYSINKKLSFIFLIIAPFLLFSLLFIMKLVFPIFEKIFKSYDKLNNVVEENLNGIRVVKSFVSEKKEIKKFNNVSSDIYNKFTKAQKILMISNPIMQFSIYLAILLVSWFGAKYIVIGSLSTGQLMGLFTYTMQMLNSLMMLSMIFVMITISRASCERIYEVLIEKSDIVNPKNPIMNVTNGSIKFDNVSFSYVNDKNKLCLKNIDFEIKSGEFVGIVGATGSGKSSLVQLIPRLYDVIYGNLLVGNINVKNYDLTVLRDNVAMVLQKNTLFKGTIIDNLKWGNKNSTLKEIKNACILSQADNFINEFPNKYNTIIEQGGTNISGGQKQRLCIARALLKNPKILIFDDSTSAIDTKNDTLIRESLKKSLPNITKIVIAQRVLSICDADKIIVLDDGMINGIGTHNQLLKENAIYKEMYYSQMKEGDDNED